MSAELRDMSYEKIQAVYSQLNTRDSKLLAISGKQLYSHILNKQKQKQQYGKANLLRY